MRVLLSRGFAALSKPRCGSTSLRRVLDPFIDPAAGDFAVGRAGQRPPFHPHITGPALRHLLNKPDLELMITARHPVEMLWSYYKFFQPDRRGRYNFHPDWSGSVGPDFETWVIRGRVGMNPLWKSLAPGHVSGADLSSLSLDAHAMDRDGQLIARVFPVEEPARLEGWLSDRLGMEVTLPNLNSSSGEPSPSIGSEAKARIREMFRWESVHYSL
jgi:hypothetical protein